MTFYFLWVAVQVLSDLKDAAGELGLGPRPLSVAVKTEHEDDEDDDDEDEQEEGELQISVKDGLTGKEMRG